MGINDKVEKKEYNGVTYEKKLACELYNDNFENAKRYNIPHAQLIIADIPYNLGNNAYASNPSWYEGGDNKNGESDTRLKNIIPPGGLKNGSLGVLFRQSLCY